MKKLLILFLLISNYAISQTITASFGSPSTATEIKGVMVSQNGLTLSSNLVYEPTRLGSIRYNPITEVMQLKTSAGWIDVGGTPDLSGYVPTSRTITINGTAFDLTANRSWTISGNQNIQQVTDVGNITTNTIHAHQFNILRSGRTLVELSAVVGSGSDIGGALRLRDRQAASSYFGIIYTAYGLTDNRTYVLPNKSGTFAMLDDITGGSSLRFGYSGEDVTATGARLFNINGYSFGLNDVPTGSYMDFSSSSSNLAMYSTDPQYNIRAQNSFSNYTDVRVHAGSTNKIELSAMNGGTFPTMLRVTQDLFDFQYGRIRSNLLDTDNSPPTTSGTTKMVITDNIGNLSFTDIPSGGSGDNIYTTNGTLTGNRSIIGDLKSLSFYTLSGFYLNTAYPNESTLSEIVGDNDGMIVRTYSDNGISYIQSGTSGTSVSYSLASGGSSSIQIPGSSIIMNSQNSGGSGHTLSVAHNQIVFQASSTLAVQMINLPTGVNTDEVMMVSAGGVLKKMSVGSLGGGGSMVYPSAGIPVSDGSAWLTSVTGTANQLLRRNSGNTAYEFFTPTYLTSVNNSNWSGTQLSVANGGTGTTTLTGVVIGNGTSAMTAVTGTANQLLRRNSGNTAYEFFTPSYLTSNQSITISGDASGTGTTAITLTLATINANVGTFNNVTVNAKGLVTAASNVSYLTSESDPLALKIASNLSDLNSAPSARTNLGGTTVGQSFFTLSNPSAITFPRINANNTVTAQTATNYRTDLGLGSLATLSSINNTNWSGTQLSVANGGTGATTLTGILVGNGTGAVTAITGTANQLMRRNAGNTAYEFFTPTYLTSADLSDYVTISTSQTITAAKTFSAVLTWRGGIASDMGALTTSSYGTGNQGGAIQLRNNEDAFFGTIHSTKLTANRLWGGPNASGTIALQEWVTAQGYSTNSGTVTSVSVVSANGFAGTVATNTTTPAITLTTSITGLLKGNGTAISAVVSGTDIKTINGNSILGSGNIVISATTPTLQQVTTAGNSTVDIIVSEVGLRSYVQVGVFTEATSAYRAVLSVDGSNNGQLHLANNATGMAGIIKADNITASNKTFQLPNKSGTFAMLDDVSGGSMVYPAAGIPVSDGSAWLTSVTGTANQLLRRNAGNTAYEFFTPTYLTSVNNSNWSGTQLSVANGGTGATTLTGVVIGNGTSAMTAVTGTANQLLRRNAGNTAYEFFTPTYLTANQSITLSGDISGTGTTSITTTLATVNSNTGTFGSATQVAQFTVNGKGLITAASNVSIAINANQITAGTLDAGRIAGTATNGFVATLVGGVPTWQAAGGGSMVYPGAGVAVSTGSAWGTSLDAATLATLTGSQTLTNKTINHDNNNITNIPRQAGYSIVSPTASERLWLFQAGSNGATATTGGTVALRGTSPSVTYSIHFGTTYGTSQGTVRSSTTVNTIGVTSITITTSAIPANAHVWLETSAVSGTIDEFTPNLKYKE